jgi:uncharacterized protein
MIGAVAPVLVLRALPGELAIARLPADAPAPAWAGTGALSSVTRTARELSVVCAAEAVPAAVRCERGWRALAVDGPLDFALTGVLAALAAPLAAAEVPLLALSSFDTDHVLVRAGDLARAAQALRRAGHDVRV